MEETAERKHILFVDDDQNVLQGLQRMLRSQRAIWEMEFAASGREALDMLDQKVYDIVISDMRMPGMDGVEFLSTVRKKHPHTIRFILSGQTSKEALIRAIGPTHQFLTKPCDADSLKKAIDRALNLRKILTSRSLISTISQIKSLPSLPTLYLQLESEMKSPVCSIHNVAEIIEQDVAMSAKILHMVNTAFYGFRQEISSIPQAVKLLGLDTIQSLVFVAQVFSGYQSQKALAPFLDKLWKHSMSVSSLAKSIARTIRRDETFLDATFKAGLFHDFGKLILITAMPRQFLDILRLLKEKQLDFHKAEMETIGTSHAEIGAYLLGLWGFADTIVEAVAFHHRPGLSQSEQTDSITSIHVANALDYDESFHDSSTVGNYKLDYEYLQCLGVEPRLAEWREIHIKEAVKERQ